MYPSPFCGIGLMDVNVHIAIYIELNIGDDISIFQLLSNRPKDRGDRGEIKN